MAGLKEIERRLKSVTNTKKITYAMKLVSAAKLKKAQDAVVNSRFYTDALNELLNSLAREQLGGDLAHSLMRSAQTVKKIRLVVFGGSRGLCGGYNTNINRRIELFLKEKSQAGLTVDGIVVGRKPAEYYRRLKRELVKSYETLTEDATRWPIDDITRSFELDFLNGEVDEVYIIYTKFKSAISMNVICDRLLPMSSNVTQTTGSANETTAHSTASVAGVTLFEPSAAAVFSSIMPRILRTKIRQACLDAKASEQGSRMTAMDAATRNAGELINKLRRTKNKLRQGGITAELLDIIGGTEALK